ncbi:hypothetical protein [Photobacterium sp. OFAV2-7]|uniref:hypothetical protein n=1 Tax=Photobacterium sp. OFAV2-7 TaxID=2917748 RepID=UPI001EF5EF65|nr:hypothetical protein [Photobacterium sp. OFAV2-7]MCG7588742.1 hypothetical protein [Photobacterium sp. OFAV2-7]
MNKASRSSGFLTLMVAVILLLIGSYAFFESADTSLFLIKRFQNTLVAKKLHWAAQGGLECAFAVNKQNAGQPPPEQNYSDCEKEVLPVEELGWLDVQVTVTQEGSNPSLYNVESKASKANARGERSISKNIEVTSNSVMPGIFKTSSMLQLTGDFALLPNKNTNKDGKNECIAMVVKDKKNFVHSDSTAGSNLIIRDNDGYSEGQVPPSVDLTALNNSAMLGDFACAPGYQSFNQLGTNEGQYLAKDIHEDPAMDMFKDLFRVSKEKWKEIRDSQFTGSHAAIINKDNTDVMVENCADEINKAYKNGAKRIWIDGSCNLGSSDKSATDGMPIDLNTPADNKPDMEVMIVVRDGIIYSPGQVGISGLLYQFKTGVRADSVMTADMVTTCKAAGFCTDSSQSKRYENKAFYTHGALYAFGGLAVDMPNLAFEVFGSLWAEYDISKWQGILSPDGGAVPSVSTVKWKEGTWRD